MGLLSRKRLAFAGFFLALSALYFFSADKRVGIYDESLVLTDSLRVMHGLVPHRDFYYNYGPAKIYLLAGIFSAFHPSVFAARIFAACSDAFMVLAVFAIVRHYADIRTAILCSALELVWPLLAPWALLLAIMLWATRLLDQERPAVLLLSGVMAGVATLFRYDMGLALIACHSVALALYRRRALLPYLAGCTLVLVPVAVLYVHAHMIHDLIFDIFTYTRQHYREARALPLPGRYSSPVDFVVYFLPLVLCAVLYVILRTRGSVPLLALGMLAAVVYAKGFVRASASQMMPAVVLSIVLLCLLPKKIRPTLCGAFLVLAAAGTILLAQQHRKHSASPPESWCGDRNSVTRDRCYTLDGDHIRTVEFLESHDHPGDTLYVGLPHHDRIYINDNATYFATQLLPATRWSQFDPYLQNSVPIQREMITDLEQNRPRFVVLDSEFDHNREPNGSSVSTGVHLLDDYIRAHYEPIRKFGEMSVLEDDKKKIAQ